MLNRKTLSVAIAASLLSIGAGAEIVNGKTSAMGGVGLAGSDFKNGALMNPAQAACFEKDDDVAVNLNLGAIVSDPDELIDTADDIDNLINELGNRAVTEADATKLKSLLNDIDGALATAHAGGYLQVAIPSEVVSAVFFAAANAYVGATAEISDADIALIDNAVANGSALNEDQLTSRILAYGAIVKEYGVALAKTFKIKNHDVNFGITPKYQGVETIAYNETVANYDDVDFGDSKNSKGYNNFNVDLGTQMALSERWLFGATLKNAIGQDYERVDGSTLSIEPQLQTGVMYKASWVSAGVDLDLNPIEDLTGRGDYQMARLGVEFDAFDWAQLRMGYAYDMKGTLDNVMTAGIGLSPFGVVNFDIAGFYGENDTYGAMLQLGMNF